MDHADECDCARCNVAALLADMTYADVEVSSRDAEWVEQVPVDAAGFWSGSWREEPWFEYYGTSRSMLAQPDTTEGAE